ncbi:hypothetical protein MHI39_21300 [Heyndrickxia sp. FSL K6-6286]|uniref:hypothetical protein n=1 Tax=Heyndrickxia sp. FSL K6-6286 TaxID=2921510 RepID=UPI00315A5AC0
MDIKKNYKINSKCIYYEIDSQIDLLKIYSRKKEFTLNGKSIYDVVNILKLSDEDVTLEDIGNKLDLDFEYVYEIVNILTEYNLIELIHEENKVPFMDRDTYQNLQSYFTSKNVSNVNNEVSEIYKRKIGIIGNSQLSNILFTYLNKIFSVEIIENSSTLTDKDLYIVVDDHENIDLFKHVSKKLYNKTNFLRIVVDVESIHIGPLIIANESACYSCFLNRLITNNDNPDLFVKYNKNFRKIDSLPQEYLDICFNLVKLELINFFSNAIPCNVVGNEYALFFENMETYLSPVLRIPNCTLCYKESL